MRAHVARRVTITLGIFAGMRPGEIAALQWENVDLSLKVIHVRHTLSRFDGLKGPKTKAGERDIPMNAVVLAALNEAARYERLMMAEAARTPRRDCQHPVHAAQHRARRRFDAGDVPEDEVTMTGYVLRTKMGNTRQTHSSGKLWRHTMREAGMWDEVRDSPAFTPHALRHAAASLFIEGGLDPFLLKKVMGHKSVNTTYNVYGHMFPEDRRLIEAVELSVASVDATRAQQEAASA